MLLSAEQIASYCAGEILGGSPATMVHNMSWDSREISSECLYIALPGSKVDGHDFCLDAAHRGAAAVLVSRAMDAQTQHALVQAGATIIQVEDTQDALAALAAAWRTHLKGNVIALTGSSGKTTTKNLVRDVLSAAGSVVATKANQNNELGVPATLLAAEEDTNFVVVEMGMRGQGQISELCAIAKPAVALVTNVGTSHMELLGSRDAIAQAKAEIFLGLDAQDGVAFINAHDDMRDALISYGDLAARGVPIIFFDGSGAAPTDKELQSCVYATDIGFDEAGNAHFTLHTPQDHAPCALQLAGQHNVCNALAAAAVGFYYGLDAPTIAQALAQSLPERGRQSIIELAGDVRVVDDSYNANPDSMLASLATFRRMQVAGRRIAVLGNMGELGSYEEEGHALVGHAAAESALDMLVCVGTTAQIIARAAETAGLPGERIVCVSDAEEAFAHLDGKLAAGDCVLVKASHSVGLDRLVRGLVDSRV